MTPSAVCGGALGRYSDGSATRTTLHRGRTVATNTRGRARKGGAALSSGRRSQQYRARIPSRAGPVLSLGTLLKTTSG
jgi:hypothetical protein